MLAQTPNDNYMPQPLLWSNQSNLHSPAYSDYDQYSNDMIENKKVGKWTPEEDDLLRKYVPIYGEKQWRKIAEHIPGRTSIQCLHRWTKILKPGLVKGPWTPEEDQKLIAWVKREGPTKWAQAANFIKGRSGKQCRERWFNNLNPGVKKGNWSKEEDELIFELYQKYGSSWSKIAKYIPGRTENAIKNRFYSTLRKLAADKRKCKGDMNHSETDSVYDDSKSTVDGYNQAPNTLYKLLQEKTIVVEENEEGEGDDKDDKNLQTFNINGEKFIVLRDVDVPEEVINQTASKLAQQAANTNPSLNYEESSEIYLEPDNKDNIIQDEEYDRLHNKLLSYCQTNYDDTHQKTKSNKRTHRASYYDNKYDSKDVLSTDYETRNNNYTQYNSTSSASNCY